MSQNGVENFAILAWKLEYFLVTYSTNYTILGMSTASLYGKSRQRVKKTTQIIWGNSKAVHI